MNKKKNNVDLVCSVAELSGLFADSSDLEGFLQKVVNMVAAHMRASVCSVYLYDEAAAELVLSATRGLNPESIGRTRLKIGEGITGTALKELRPICEADGDLNPYFKLIPGTNEEAFKSFLAVPILRGVSRVGVLVVQDVNRAYFDDADTKALRAIASQLAGTIESARLLMSLHPSELFTPTPAGHKESQLPDFFKGESGASGIARGPAAIYGQPNACNLGGIIEHEDAANLTLQDFDRALESTAKELEDLEQGMKDAIVDLSVSMIFSAQLLMLKDVSFSTEIRRRIEAGTNVVDAVRSVVEEFVQLFESNKNPRVKEKTQDIQDLGVRVLQHLVPDGPNQRSGHYAGRIVVANELFPSDMLKITAQNVAGMIITEGSFTAHLSILARSLGVPTVILKDARIKHVPEGVNLLLDANQGTVYVNPGPDVVQKYNDLENAGEDLERLSEDVEAETWTRDGERVHLLANINLLSEVELAKSMQVEGVGLYRSEFPYLVRNDFPSEEEQYRIYRKLVESMEGKPVTFRTLDVGGDKMLSYFPSSNEDNPFLGLRAIRFSLRYPEVFRQQIRAFLRAGAGADIGIMFPLVSSLDDFLQAWAIVNTCMDELKKEEVEYNPAPAMGVMVELPSTLAIVAELAEKVDFLCLGTNDLVQYLLGVDRTNADVAEHYLAHHPAVLRALDQVARTAGETGKELSICGEMAGDPELIPFLLGIGIRKFSLDARKITPIQQKIQQTDSVEARKFADKLLKLGTLREIEQVLVPNSISTK